MTTFVEMCVEYEDKTCARICGLSYRSAGPEITSLDAFCGAKQYKLVKRAQEGPNLTPQTLEKSGYNSTWLLNLGELLMNNYIGRSEYN